MKASLDKLCTVGNGLQQPRVSTKYVEVFSVPESGSVGWFAVAEYCSDDKVSYIRRGTKMWPRLYVAKHLWICFSQSPPKLDPNKSVRESTRGW
jgi:hypothetical protein